MPIFPLYRTDRPRIIGHRGAAAHAPENTMASFAQGVQLGADAIELDVHLSRDGHLIVMHDPKVSRTTNGHGHIKDMTLAEIKQLDAGAWFNDQFRGERVPTLVEVLDWAKGRIPFIVEIKGDPQPAVGIEEKIVKLLCAYDLLDDTLIISFHHPALLRIKELEPRLVTAISYLAQLIDPVAAVRAANANGALGHASCWTPEMVTQVRAAGIAALTWYTEKYTPEGMQSLMELGLDGILIDYPGQLRDNIQQADRTTPQGGM